MKRYLIILLRIVVAIILLQTLRYKFFAHPDSVYIFTKVGMEPVGRIGIGILELIAAILLLIPGSVWVGATLSLGIITGAIMMHLTVLGIEVQGDGGSLFYLAITIFVLSLIILWFERFNIPLVKNIFKHNHKS